MENGQNAVASPGGDINQAGPGVIFQRIHAKSQGLSSNKLSRSAVYDCEETAPAADKNAIVDGVHIHAAGLTAGRIERPGLHNFQRLRVELIQFADILHVKEDVSSSVCGQMLRPAPQILDGSGDL